MPKDSKQTVAVVGGGPAGLMAAEVLSQGGAAVTVYDRMPSLGRKLLIAGRGGLNLTHSEDLPRFLQRYGARRERLAPVIEAFPPTMLRDWAEGLGQETFVGSSGRVFPKAMKASPLLRAWLRRLDAAGVQVRLRHRWLGWDGRALSFDTPNGRVNVESAATILALGGASWPKFGSDGGWQAALSQAGIAIASLRPANCGFRVGWSEIFRNRFEGQPLKSADFSFGETKIRGEAIVTREGIEGGAIYALSAPLREAILAQGEATLTVDLRPDIAQADLQKRLGAPRGKQSMSNFLRKAGGLSPVALGLLQEITISANGNLAKMTPEELAGCIKALPLRLNGVAPIERAISTAGGVAFEEIDERFMLRKKPGVFVAGEMLDWEAPTGGYLLQASFATGIAAAKGALAWLQAKA